MCYIHILIHHSKPQRNALVYRSRGQLVEMGWVLPLWVLKNELGSSGLFGKRFIQWWAPRKVFKGCILLVGAATQIIGAVLTVKADALG